MSTNRHLELVRESLVAVVNEMRANIIHSSYSSIIYEGHDFSCALLGPGGKLVAQGLDDNPLHIFAVPYSTARVLETFAGDIHEGDIFLHNDPYTGGTHLNDVLMLYPVFHEGRLVMFAAARCHWGDVGGMTPGSLSGRVREIYQEGMRIVPTRICERGRMNTAFLELLFGNMRIRQEREGDFRTMLGTSRKAAEHVQRLYRRFGAKVIESSIAELMARAEGVMRERISEVPDGIYHAEGYLDNNGHENEPLIARLKLTVARDRITADFSGSSPQTAGPTNVGPAMAFNALALTIKSFLDPHSPVNHGSFEPLDIVNPPGNFLNATLPAPCGGMVECRALMISVLVSALGQAMPQRRVGDLKGGANHVYISGRGATGDMFLLYEYPAGGTGATARTEGHHGIRAWPDGDFNAVWGVEVLEAQAPVQVAAYGIREGSGGAGEHSGGCGIRRDLEVLVEGASLSVLSDKNIIPPYGVAGGSSGACNRFVVIRGGEVIEPSSMPGKVGGFILQAGDIVRIESAGGGGWGDPLAREPALVAADVRLGLLSAQLARDTYGVASSGDGCCDEEATKALRSQLRKGRVFAAVQRAADDLFDGPRRMVALPQGLREQLDLAAGELVELDTPAAGSALRAWVAERDADGEQIALGPIALSILGVAQGDRVHVRRAIRRAAPREVQP